MKTQFSQERAARHEARYHNSISSKIEQTNEKEFQQEFRRLAERSTAELLLGSGSRV